MPVVPPLSPATGNPTHPSFVHTINSSFVDNSGRTLLLRGVNLSGANKAPLGHLSYILDDFWLSAEDGGESFVGRPLNLNDGSADVHLARLKGWGFNLIRLPFTWESLERQGPKKYDYEYMDYLIRLLCKCRDYGFRVYMDPHQDTWSRFSGGSGAPFWTLPACGINPAHISATQAAILHCEFPLPHAPDPASLPAMLWSTNYGRLLSQTLFTFFFAGRVFAPKCIIDGMNIQDYLQSHYIEAVGQLADRIRAYDGGSLFEETIIGWEPMNEPFEGLVGWDDLNLNPTKQGSTLKKGTHPTPAQSMRLGMGKAQTVENWSFGATGPRRDGEVTIDPKGRKVWADPDLDPGMDAGPSAPDRDPTRRAGERPDGTHPRWGWKRDVSSWPLGTCPWALHGVWDIETGYVLRPSYFKFHPADPSLELEFLADFWKPHWVKYAERIRRAHSDAIMFVQPPVFAVPPRMDEVGELKRRCVYSPHYYDGLTLVLRHWNWFNVDALGVLRGRYASPLQAVRVGEGAIRKVIAKQIGYFLRDVKARLGDYPVVMGEIGVPFDMDSKRAYGWTEGGKGRGDYSAQEKALDASLNACDAAGWTVKDDNDKDDGAVQVEEGLPVHWTVWNYVPDDHSHDWGDGWNMEDLSLFSTDDLMVLGEGGEKGSGVHGASSATLVKRSPSPPLQRKLTDMTTTTKMNTTTGKVKRGSESTSSLASYPPHPSRQPQDKHDKNTPSLPPSVPTNPYDFLVNGSRASRAFVRPFPVRTVGRPVVVEFDIHKAVFKMVVRVAWDDRARRDSLLRGREGAVAGVNSEGGNGEAVKGKGDVRVDVLVAEEEEEEDLPTEIYVPLVHYAHPGVVENSALRNGWARWPEDDEGDREEDSDTDADTEGMDSPVSGTGSGSRPGSMRGRSPVRVGTASTLVNVTPVPPVLGTAATAKGTTMLGSKMSSATMVTTATDMTAALLDSNADSGEAGRKGKGVDIYGDGDTEANTLEHCKFGVLPVEGKGVDLIDVDVKISGPRVVVSGTGAREGEGEDVWPGKKKPSGGSPGPGKWDVQGQVLRWWYDVPPPPMPVGQNKDKDKEGKGGEIWDYTIEVRRQGGPLKSLWDLEKERERAATGVGRGMGRGICEAVCPEDGGCVVM